MPFHLPPTTHIGAVHLKIADQERMLAFYGGLLGLKEIAGDGHTVSLSASGIPPALLKLTVISKPQPRPPRATGLFHMAIRVPTRSDLAGILERLLTEGWPLEGASDHGVSEALYLADPEDNGVEIYVDRPRESWPHHKGNIEMSTDPLDVEALLKLAPEKSSGLPADTVIGHVHLKVSDLKTAREFYHELLGFEITQETYPGALFFAAGGYHHHIAANIWTSRGAASPPPDSLGLSSFEIILPDGDTIAALWNRLQDAGVYVSSVQSGTLAGIQAADRDNLLVELLAPAP